MKFFYCPKLFWDEWNLWDEIENLWDECKITIRKEERESAEQTWGNEFRKISDTSWLPPTQTSSCGILVYSSSHAEGPVLPASARIKMHRGLQMASGLFWHRSSSFCNSSFCFLQAKVFLTFFKLVPTISSHVMQLIQFLWHIRRQDIGSLLVLPAVCGFVVLCISPVGTDPLIYSGMKRILGT